jgi:hypothetical protein
MFCQGTWRLDEQLEHAKEWRDVINSYFYRKTGIADELGRKYFDGCYVGSMILRISIICPGKNYFL